LAIYLLLLLAFERNSVPGREFLNNLIYFATYTSNWFVDLRGERVIIFYFAWSLAFSRRSWPLEPASFRPWKRGTAAGCAAPWAREECGHARKGLGIFTRWRSGKRPGS